MRFLFMFCYAALYFLVGFSIPAVLYANVDTTHAIIHHTDSSDKSAIKIHEEHKERTWVDANGKMQYWWGIGYHFVIRADGNIEEGRPLSMRGAHARGSRNGKVGVALTGRDDFTPAQITSLKKLLTKLKTTVIERHSNTCPGSGLDVSAIAKKLRIKQLGVK